MKIRIIKGYHMTAVEIKLAHALLSNAAEAGMIAKSPRKTLELLSIDRTGTVWTAKLKVTDLCEKARYLVNGEIVTENVRRTFEIEIYGEGVVAMPEVAEATTESETVVTPAQATVADAVIAKWQSPKVAMPEATAEIMQMPFNPMQNNEMFHNQIRGFLKCPEAVIEKMDTSPYENARYLVTTPNHKYLVERVGDYYQFVAIAEATATATATASAVAMPAAAESQMTESEMSAFRDNLEKLSPKQLLVSLVEISAAKRHLESLSQGEAGESPFHKLAREVWITSDQMTLVDQYQKIGLPTRLINMPSESTEAAEIIPEVSTDKTEVIPDVEVATTEAATPYSEAEIIKEMLDSDITRCRIQAILYQAGLAGYRVTKRAPEQLSTKELADLSEAETNIILDKDDNEVWDAGWASWRERTMKFIDMVKAKQQQPTVLNLSEVTVGIPGKGIARCAFAPTAKDEDREAVMMVLANGISLSDVIHHRRTKYKLLADPRCFKGFGVVLAESYEGLKHKIPFIVRWGDEGWNEEALADFSKVVNL